MRKAESILTVAGFILLAAGGAAATEWVADFTSTPPESFTGTDNSAVASYTDTLGGNPNSYTVTFPLGGSAPPGWLTTRTLSPTELELGSDGALSGYRRLIVQFADSLQLVFFGVVLKVGEAFAFPFRSFQLLLLVVYGSHMIALEGRER